MENAGRSAIYAPIWLVTVPWMPSAVASSSRLMSESATAFGHDIDPVAHQVFERNDGPHEPPAYPIVVVANIDQEIDVAGREVEGALHG